MFNVVTCIESRRGLLSAKVHIFHCFSLPCPSLGLPEVTCIRDPVGSCWPGINVVKSWLRMVHGDLLRCTKCRIADRTRSSDTVARALRRLSNERGATPLRNG